MPSPLIELTNTDRAVYAERLRDFLPPQVVDVHTHVYRVQDIRAIAPAGEARTVTWPDLVARENPIEHLLETYRVLLPAQQVTPVIFASLPSGDNQDALNAYVADSAREHQLPALLFSHPAWSAEELRRRLLADGFLGVKSYLTMAPDYLPAGEIRIFDIFPPHQLEELNRLHAIVMLHIPRSGRLKDPVNLGQMLEIDRNYPDLQVIIAHVGRAYCDTDAGDAFAQLRQTRHLRFDICANTNAHIFTQLIECVGPQRILFGSDMPITRMRMRRITRDGHYVNLVPRGLYGDVSNDPNMGEVDGDEAAQLTTFLYEEILAFREASEATGLTANEVEDVFYANAMRLFNEVRLS